MNEGRAMRAAASLWGVAFVVAILQICPSIAGAEAIPPSKVVVRTKAYQPQETNFPRGSYEYLVSWEGIPVGSASIHVGTTYRDEKKMLDVVATARSAGIVALFYRLRHRSESIFSAQELKPVEFVSQQIENTRFTNLKIEFSPDGLIKSEIRKGRPNRKEEVKEVSFKSENTTFDPISAAFLARSLPVNPAEELSFDVFNGEDRYLISLHVVGREKIRVAGEDYDAFKVEPSVKKLTDTERDKRLRKAYLWVSTDGRREVLKLESEVFIGSVSATLVRFVPSGAPAADIDRAPTKQPSQNE